MSSRTYLMLPLKDGIVMPKGQIDIFDSSRTTKNWQNFKEGDELVLLRRKAFIAHDAHGLTHKKSKESETLTLSDMCSVGILAKITSNKITSDQSFSFGRKIVFTGLKRFSVSSMTMGEPAAIVAGSFLETEVPSSATIEAFQPLIIQSMRKMFDSGILKSSAYEKILLIADPEEMLDVLVNALDTEIMPLSIKQDFLEMACLEKRYNTTLETLVKKLDHFSIQKKIRSKIHQLAEENQKRYLDSLQKEAIHDASGGDPELSTLFERIKKSKMSPPAKAKAESEFKKLCKNPQGSDAHTMRNYIELLCDLPWGERSFLENNLNKAEKVLEDSHFGLKKIKEAITMHIAIHNRTKGADGNVLCLAGPPGVGKTSLAKSIAKATGRQFVRIALGGVKDEAEIRGHRRTYMSALPGKILSQMKTCGSLNPVFLLDEIDKVGQDWRGNPADGLLEVLDPEQNNEFVDHYLEVPFPLNECLFICTANDVTKIPPALLDRMDVIQMSSYTHEEKLEIAKKYLVKKQMSKSGALDAEFSISDKAIGLLIDRYTRESGVRDLDRKIKYLVGKAIVESMKTRDPTASNDRTVVDSTEKLDPKQSGKISPTAWQGSTDALGVEDGNEEKKNNKKKASKKKLSITTLNLEKYAGPALYSEREGHRSNQIGIINGLAWSEVGGSVLTIESTLVSGSGKIISTGRLGKVMEESASIAFSCVRSIAQKRGINLEILTHQDIHVHVPAGATPKDGPSAGCGIALSIISALLKMPISNAVAVTGEISLTGQIWPIGGLKEKLLAAHRSGIKTVMIPASNKAHLVDIPQSVLDELKIVYMDHVDDALEHALLGYSNQFISLDCAKKQKSGEPKNTPDHDHSPCSTIEKSQ